MATLSFDLTTKLATVPVDLSISCQEIYDQFRDFEDRGTTMSNADLISAAGKDSLAGGASTIITVRLLDGWRIKFADRPGPTVVEAVVTGGNLVASDEAGADQLPIEPADFVFVSFANATTGALLGSLAPEFQGGIWVDAVLGTSGTSFPIGTSTDPVDNFEDAAIIAATYGIQTYFVQSDIATTADLNHKKVIASTGGYTITMTGSDVTGTHFERVFVAGSVTSTGAGFFGEYMGFFPGFMGMKGVFTNSMFLGKSSMGGNVTLIDCYEGFAQAGHTGLDFSLTGAYTLQAVRYTGRLDLYQMATGDSAVIDLLPGSLKIESDCVGGDLILRGFGEWELETGAVLDSTITTGFNPADVDSIRTRKWITNREDLADISGTRTIYDDDGVSVLETQTVTDKDGNAISIPVAAPARRSDPV